MEVYSDTGLPLEIRKISNKQANLPQKGIRKRTNKTQSRRREIIKRRELRSKKEIKTIEKINEGKSYVFEKINKIDKPLTRLTMKKRERTKINKIRNERGEITIKTTEIQKPYDTTTNSYM